MPPLPFEVALAHPWVSLVVLAAGAAFFGRTARPGRGSAARLVPRVLLVLAVALAAGDLRVSDREPPRLRVFVVDRSRSFEPARASVRAAIEEGARDLDPRRDRIAAVVFGALPVLATPTPLPSDATRALADAVLAATVDPLGSDLGAALGLARETARGAGGAGEIVLLSDGRDTGGGAREAASLLAVSGIPLHALAPQAPPVANARVARVVAPGHAAPGELVRVSVHVETTIASAVRVTLQVKEGEATAAGPSHVTVSVEPGAPARPDFLVRMGAKEGLVVVRARVQLLATEDGFPEDDALDAPILVGDRPRCVLVTTAPAEPWRELLAGFDVETVIPARLAGAVLDRARGVPDLVLLDEVPAREIDAEGTAALRDLLAAGSGLLVTGCVHAFGPGDYPGTELEALLPVRSGPPGDRGKPLLLELVLDHSASMATLVTERESRFVAAVAAAIPSLRELRPGDQVGVVLFSDTPHVFEALGPMTDETGLKTRLTNLDEPNGGTRIALGLELGLEQLASRPGRRLLVLVTDGEDPKVAEHLDRVRAAAARAAEGGDLQVALIRVGDDPEHTGEETLRTLARAIDPREKIARFYPVDEAGKKLGELIRGELVPSVRSEVRRGVFPVIGATGLPSIEAYAPVRPRELTRTLLSVLDPDHEGPAALAVASTGGAGKAVVLATSVTGGGSALIRDPAGRTALLAIVREAARSERGSLELTCVREPGAILVAATANRELPSNLVVAAGASRQPLLPVAPGRFEARIPCVTRDAVMVRVLEGDIPLAHAVAPGAASLELAAPARDLDLLAELAALSGNPRGLLAAIGPLPRPPHPESVARTLAPDLALAGVALLVLEGALLVALERLAARHAGRRAFQGARPVKKG
jgi:hypothetical protein